MACAVAASSAPAPLASNLSADPSRPCALIAPGLAMDLGGVPPAAHPPPRLEEQVHPRSVDESNEPLAQAPAIRRRIIGVPDAEGGGPRPAVAVAGATRPVGHHDRRAQPRPLGEDECQTARTDVRHLDDPVVDERTADDPTLETRVLGRKAGLERHKVERMPLPPAAPRAGFPASLRPPQVAQRTALDAMQALAGEVPPAARVGSAAGPAAGASGPGPHRSDPSRPPGPPCRGRASRRPRRSLACLPRDRSWSPDPRTPCAGSARRRRRPRGPRG